MACHRFRVVLLLTLLIAAMVASGEVFVDPEAPPEGPGVPAVRFEKEALFKPLSHIDKSRRAHSGHVTTTMHRGYMVVVGAKDGGGGKGSGGFAFFDLSDPRDPRCVYSQFFTDATGSFGEAHTFGFARMSIEGRGERDVAAIIDNQGVQFWDWTDPTDPEQLSRLTFPETRGGDYGGTVWWLSFQAPYLYAGGTGSGVHVVDASDPRSPRRVARVPTSNLGGVKAGPVFAVGNLLVVADMDSDKWNIAVLDISDPTEPMLTATARGKTRGQVYSSHFNGGLLYQIATRVEIVDLHDPFEPTVIESTDTDTGSKGGYGMIQDQYLFMGASNRFTKLDVSDSTQPEVVNTIRGLPGDRDGAGVMGHLAVSSDDHHHGSALLPHQTEPDTTPPAPNYFNPAPGDVYVAPTARIGLTMTDQIDLRTVTDQTMIVRPVDGEALSGTYSVQTGMINFTPDQPLRKETTYEVVLVKGGIGDLAGNVMEQTVRYRFSTGSNVAGKTGERDDDR